MIGACILSNDALSTAVGLLNPEDFADFRAKVVFQALTSMFRKEKPVDFITLSDTLSSDGTLERIGGQSYIDELVNANPYAQNVKAHAEIIIDNSIRRKLEQVGRTLINSAKNMSISVQSAIDDAEVNILQASQNKTSENVLRVRETIPSVFRKIENSMNTHGNAITGYATGFSDLDRFTGGLQPGSLNVIAARPSMGKTAFAMNIAQFGGGDSNAPVLIFSVEMPSEQLIQRMISAESGVDLSRLTRGLFDSAEFEEVRRACDTVSRRNIYINDSTTLSAMDFRGHCRRFKTRHPDLALIVVDYLQLMSSGEQAARTANRQQEVSDISRMLKATARETECPVIALSQLSRQAENRSDKKPQLADLRDSGAIEQDADLVMMMFREDYYTENENNDLTDSVAEIRVAKNRNGSTGVFRLTFRREITRFYNHGEI